MVSSCRQQPCGTTVTTTHSEGNAVTNLADNLTRTAEQHGDRPAIKLDDLVLTYAELQDGARRVAALLRSKGVGPGDRVGLVCPTCRRSR